ncbi:MAG TPA: hypothetical protein VKA01_04670 [Vicinamibacteria bacterium]|nr:hypothetical protein [Vicinamibacteria bacterium]
MILALALVLAAEGRPLFYWGARPALVTLKEPATRSEEAVVLELHAAPDQGDLVMRFSFDRPVREALWLPDGTPVSGRLKAVVYIDTDDDRRTGTQEGSSDLRTGAERRIELSALAMGEDAEEHRAATALVAATLHGLTQEGRRRTLWRADSELPNRVSVRAEFVELRVPADRVGAEARCRFILVSGEDVRDGRLE